MNNIIVQDVGAEKDAITSLRAPTHFGRPNWDRVFSSIAEKHPETDVGVVSLSAAVLHRLSLTDLTAYATQFFCGPAVLSRQLHVMSNKYSHPRKTRFFFGKGASTADLFSLVLSRRYSCAPRYRKLLSAECTLSAN